MLKKCHQMNYKEINLQCKFQSVSTHVGWNSFQTTSGICDKLMMMITTVITSLRIMDQISCNMKATTWQLLFIRDVIMFLDFPTSGKHKTQLQISQNTETCKHYS